MTLRNIFYDPNDVSDEENRVANIEESTSTSSDMESSIYDVENLRQQLLGDMMTTRNEENEIDADISQYISRTIYPSRTDIFTTKEEDTRQDELELALGLLRSEIAQLTVQLKGQAELIRTTNVDFINYMNKNEEAKTLMLSEIERLSGIINTLQHNPQSFLQQD